MGHPSVITNKYLLMYFLSFFYDSIKTEWGEMKRTPKKRTKKKQEMGRIPRFSPNSSSQLANRHNYRILSLALHENKTGGNWRIGDVFCSSVRRKGSIPGLFCPAPCRQPGAHAHSCSHRTGFPPVRQWFNIHILHVFQQLLLDFCAGSVEICNLHE